MVTFAAELRWILMLVCLAIFCLVFVVMVVVAWRQYRKGDPSVPNFHGSLVVVWPTARAVLLH